MMDEKRFSYHCQHKVVGIGSVTQQWRSGTFDLLLNSHRCKCELTLDVKPNHACSTYKLSHNIKAVKKFSKRMLIDLNDGLTINLQYVQKPEEDILIQQLNDIKSGKIMGPVTSSLSSKESDSIAGLKSLATSTPRQDHKTSADHNGSVFSPQFTVMKDLGKSQRKDKSSIDGDDDDFENDISIKLGPNRFLQSGRSKATEALSTKKTVSFYGNSPGMKTYSTFHSNKRKPGFLDSYPEKRSRLSDPGPGASYSWSKRLTPTTPERHRSALQGFSNLGNTCYMNAILQSLFSLETFATDLYALSEALSDLPQEQKNTQLYFPLSRLLVAKRKQSLQPDMRKNLLTLIKKAISSSARRFIGHEQHDAHEFLSQVIDQLKDEIAKLKDAETAVAENDLDTVTLKHEVVALDDDENIPRKNNSPGVTKESCSLDNLTNPTRDNFEFQVLHTITCTSCCEVLEKEETFHDLSLDMPRRQALEPLRSIQDAFDHFFLKEDIEYTCEKCEAKEAEVHHKFLKLPRILILHLKRYAFDTRVSCNTKLGQNIQIPKYLTLQSQCKECTQPPKDASLPPLLTTLVSDAKVQSLSEGSIKVPFISRSTGKLHEFQRTKRLADDSDGDSPEKRLTSRRKLSWDKGYQRSFEDSLRLTMKKAEDRRRKEKNEEQAIKEAIESSRREEEEKKEQQQKEVDLSLHGMTEEQMLELALQRSMQDAMPTANGDRADLQPPPEPRAYGGDQVSREDGATESISLETQTENDGMWDADSQMSDLCGLAWSENGSQEVTSQDNNKPSNGLLGNHCPDDDAANAQQSDLDWTPSKSSRGHLSRSDWKTGSRSDADGHVMIAEPPVGELKGGASVLDDIDTGLPKTEPAMEDPGSDGENKENYTPPKAKLIEESPKKTEDMSVQTEGGCPVIGKAEADENGEKEPDEEEQLKMAIEQSLKDQEKVSVIDDEDDDLEKAKKLSLQEMNAAVEQYVSEQQREWTLTRSKDEEDSLKVNAMRGNLPHSYQLMSVVSHLGGSSSIGHYISDVYDIQKRSWTSCDDSEVSRISEEDVIKKRERTGYIFFYMAKDVVSTIDACVRQQNAITSRLSNVLQPRKNPPQTHSALARKIASGDAASAASCAADVNGSGSGIGGTPTNIAKFKDSRRSASVGKMSSHPAPERPTSR